MTMIMAFAFLSAEVANPGASLKHQAQCLDVLAGPADREPAGRRADIGAIAADADALRHIHCLSHAGIGTTRAHLRTEHGMARCRGEQFIEIIANVGVELEHFMNRHQPFPCFRRVSQPFLAAAERFSSL